jgi:hypothetical protein
VVDRVELAVFDQWAQVGDLEYGYALVHQDLGNAAHEAACIRNVCQDVVGMQDLGLDACACEFFGELLGEEGVSGLDSLLARRLDRPFGRVDAEHGDATFGIELQQVAVIARQLDHAGRLGPLLQARLDVLPRVLDERVDKGTEVGIVVAEELLGGDGLQDLHEGAFFAERDFEWIARLWLVELLGTAKSVRWRMLSQVEEDLERRRAAGAARDLGPRIRHCAPAASRPPANAARRRSCRPPSAPGCA